MRVCVVRQSYYPLDIRVRREVEALLDSGHEVDVVCLRGPHEVRHERQGSLTIRRLPMSQSRRGRAPGYLARYAAFLVLAGSVVAALHLRRRYALVQVHSLPDTLVLVGIIPRLLGARLLLDLHEVMPEFFATKFDKPPQHPLVRFIARAEQASIRIADHTLTCTEQMREAFVARGATAEKITVVLNSADESLFDVRKFPPSPSADRFTLICHGSIEERYGLDLIVEAVAMLRDQIPELHFEVYGDGSYRPELVQLVQRLSVGDRVHISDGFVPMDELLLALSRAHVGVVAMKQDAFRDLTHCNKMFDFLALHLPVVTSRTRSVEAYFPDTALQYFEPGNAADLARAVKALWNEPTRRDAMVADATRVLEPYRWERQRAIYLSMVNRLLDQTR